MVGINTKVRWTKKRRVKGIIFAILSLTLAIAVLMQVAFPTGKPEFIGNVFDLVPKDIDLQGWVLQYQPLAESPEDGLRVIDILRFDQVAYVTYTRANTRISLYVAYWAPGSMSVRSVGYHSPDICWAEVGWRTVPEYSWEETMNVGKISFPVNHRVFTNGGMSEHVVFWHCIDGNVEKRKRRLKWTSSVFLNDLIYWDEPRHSEQFFIRISSNRPWAEIAREKIVTHFCSRWVRAAMPLARSPAAIAP